MMFLFLWVWSIQLFIPLSWPLTESVVNYHNASEKSTVEISTLPCNVRPLAALPNRVSTDDMWYEVAGPTCTTSSQWVSFFLPLRRTGIFASKHWRGSMQVADMIYTELHVHRPLHHGHVVVFFSSPTCCHYELKCGQFRSHLVYHARCMHACATASSLHMRRLVSTMKQVLVFHACMCESILSSLLLVSCMWEHLISSSLVIDLPYK